MTVTALRHPMPLDDPVTMMNPKLFDEFAFLVYGYPVVKVRALKEQIYSYFSPVVVQELEALQNEVDASTSLRWRSRIFTVNAIINGMCVFLIKKGGTAGVSMYGPSFAAMNQLRFRWFQEGNTDEMHRNVFSRFNFELRKVIDTAAATAKLDSPGEHQLVDGVLAEAICDDHILCNIRPFYIRERLFPDIDLKLYSCEFNSLERTKLSNICQKSQFSMTTNPGFKRHIQLGVPIFNNHWTCSMAIPPLLQSTMQHLNQWKMTPHIPNSIIISYFSNEMDDILFFEEEEKDLMPHLKPQQHLDSTYSMLFLDNHEITIDGLKLFLNEGIVLVNKGDIAEARLQLCPSKHKRTIITFLRVVDG